MKQAIAILTIVLVQALICGCQHEEAAVTQDAGATASTAPVISADQKLALRQQVKQPKKGDN